MGKNFIGITEKLFSEVGGLQNIEQELIDEDAHKNEISRSRLRVVSELYLSKHLQTAVDKTIASNAKLAEATALHTKVMLVLTGALVFVGLTQVDWAKLF